MLELSLQIIAAFWGTISFAILFEAPPRLYIPCSLIGASGWLIYLLANEQFNSPAIATFIASFMLTCFSRRASHIYKVPTTVFLICGIFTLVPGIGVYNLTYTFLIGDKLGILKQAEFVFKVSIAIAFGISTAFLLPPISVREYRKQIQKNI